MPSKEVLEFLKKHTPTNRAGVCEPCNDVIEDMHSLLGGEVLSIPTDSECLTWLIPKLWSVREAYIESNGKRVLDFKSHPVTLSSYSESFDGELSFEELDAHLITDPDHPNRIPYDFRFQYNLKCNGWAFCLPHHQYKEIFKTGAQYRVKIDTELKKGEMKILDYTLPGNSKETILMTSHICHPGQLNDGLSGAAAGFEMMNYLKSLPSRKYTYRYVIYPEYFGSVAFLAKAKNLDHIKYGLFLDRLAHSNRLGFSQSFNESSYVNRLVKSVFMDFDRKPLVTGYRELDANDEVFFDGPDFEIPMACIAREKMNSEHSSEDSFENADFNKYDEALKVIKSVVDAFEKDYTPVRNFKGLLYLSRYDIDRDGKREPEKAIAMDKIQILMNGKRSCVEIADELNISFNDVYSFAEAMRQKGLVTS